MRSAKDFFRPLAVGAPEPLREIPARPSRAIHFFDPSNQKMASKIPGMVGKVDVLLALYLHSLGIEQLGTGTLDPDRLVDDVLPHVLLGLSRPTS